MGKEKNMYPKDLDGGGSPGDFTFGFIVGVIVGVGAALMYYFLAT